MNPSATNRYWRSLADAAGPDSSEGATEPEFPSPWDDSINRRSFLKWTSASAAIAALAGCTREPIHQIVPYVTQPEEIIPGKPLHYATAMPRDGFAVGIIVESHEGHPTKIEGNPTHPASQGATGIFEQAALLDLYTPDRSKTVTEGGQISNFSLFFAALQKEIATQRAKAGAGLRILTRSTTSPTLIAQLEEILRQFPQARWHQYQPMARDNTLEAAQRLFGRPMETRFHLDRAKTIVLFDSDCFFAHPSALINARQFARTRRSGSQSDNSSRLYVAEPSPSLGGSVADHRLPASSAQIQNLVRELARQIGITTGPSADKISDDQHQWIHAVTEDLRQNSGQSLVIAGETQPPVVHTLVHLLNDRLGNIGNALEYADSAETHWINHRDSITQLVSEMDSGKVECLLILGGNPVFDAPADLQFASRLSRVPFRVHLGVEQNETAIACDWHIPESHFLESWSDARSFDGTTSIIQPLIMPLYDTKTAHELLHFIIHGQLRDDYDVVRDHWNSQKAVEDFEKWWRQSLHDGWIANSQLPALSLRPQEKMPLSASETEAAETVEICFRPDPTIWDGTFANNGWLQELPKPFSKVTWDNPALISPALARRFQLDSGDVVQLRTGDRTFTAPVWILPGQAENSVTVHLGLGRSHTGDTDNGIGFNGYTIRTLISPWAASNVKIIKTGNHHLLATTQNAHSVHGRNILESHEPLPPPGGTLYNPGEFKNAGYAWGMVINLNACIGCSACMIACQAENNIPVVGKDQVAAGRDMAWIRIDQYFEGPPENPRFHNQPVPCMHCENAPCELVCPVGATLHDHEGLNLQVYNRCVGTRYCSNNCPYKVRRFNFFRYADYDTPSLKPMRNPNVTVRWRGVMEKCTYCLQRISAAKIAAQLQDRPIRDGEIKTACQQVCPTEAITFGNINDPNSNVAKLKTSPLNFSMLGELNTRPRTTYLTRVGNSNPQLEDQS
jgi:molybdopterin-containing oxidoreductase family iron-sulfur binding subunit